MGFDDPAGLMGDVVRALTRPLPADRLEVRIAHGDWETEEDVQAIEAVRAAADPFWLRTVGTNDTTTLVIGQAGLRPVLDAVARWRRPWWHVQVNGAPWG